MSCIKSGKHLGAVRRWIKWNVKNGERVTWGSCDVLEHQFTVADLEEIAQQIADELEAQDDDNT